MSEHAKSELIDPLIARFERRRPLRAGSLIVTLYGDAIAPRGGSLWLGSLNALVAPFGIEPGLVRTAMSRLVSDGWFDRNRVGRSSYYRLSSHGAQTFAEAAERIYGASDTEWAGTFSLAVLTATDAKMRLSARDGLAAAGFGQIAPNVMVSPRRGPPDGAPASEAIWLESRVSSRDSLVGLARLAWDLDTLGAAYADFLKDIAPISGSLPLVERLPPPDAFRLRVLLIHEWRRIVLRDPQLPPAMLPPDWPGHLARAGVRDIYAACSSAGDAFLDSHAVAENGPLPQAPADAVRHFSP